MRTRLLTLFFTMMLSGIGSSNAQSKGDYFHDAEGNTYHQLFVDFHITEILQMKYTPENTPVDGVLSADGYSVIIKNYPGDRSVKLLIKDDSGQEKEVTKSRCFIDPVLLEL